MRYRFGDCVFDDARGALRRLDDVIALEPQVLVVLHYLLVHRQRVVSRDELLEQCWPQTYVSDAALTSCLRRVRQAIGQRQGGPTLIETLHRRGYRFVAEVIVVDEAVAVPPPAEPVLPESAPLPLEFPPAPVAPAAPQASAVPSAPTPSTAPPVAPIEVTVLAERRHLTVLSCTLAGADALSLPLDPEAHYDLMQTFYATTQAIVAPYAGHVVQQLDHGVVVYFGYPQAHEDDAQRAVRSGLGLVEAVRHGALSAFADARAPLTARVGIATGMMIVRAGGDTASQPALGVGSASTLALRLGALAQPGTVVISEATAQLVSDYFACKAWEEAVRVGPDDPQVVYEVHGESPLQTRLEVGVVYGLTPFVGREAEVALLRERWGYVHEGLGQVVVIRGEAGIGKSRLVQVLKEEVMGEAVMALECRCSPYHQHTAFYPLIDLLHRALQVPSGMGSPADSLERLEGLLTRYALALEETVPLLAGLLSLSLPEGRYAPLPLTPSRQRECTLETLVSLVLAQTEVSPLLLIVEDVHWADASTLEFLGLLLEQVSLVPLLVVLTCRPEFEPPWGQHSGVTRVVLNRLTQAQMETMIVQVAANKCLPDAVLAQVVDKTDGVPLFIEELTRMVVESGQLVEHEGHYELREALTHWVILGRIQRGSLLAAQGQTTEGFSEMRQGLAAYQAGGARVWLPIFLTQIAEVCGQQGQTAEGLSLLAEAQRVPPPGGDRSWEAEQYRLQGELLLQHEDRHTGAVQHGRTPRVARLAEVEASLRQALEVARRQQAKSLELRAAISLARLWQRQDRCQEAYELLAPVYAWFTEGFDTADLQDAERLLEGLRS